MSCTLIIPLRLCSSNHPLAGWQERMAPSQLVPGDLHAAMLEKRLSSGGEYP